MNVQWYKHNKVKQIMENIQSKDENMDYRNT